MYQIFNNHITAYLDYLKEEERATATIEKYTRDVHAFIVWLGNKSLDKDIAIAYKQHLAKTHKAASVNAALAALNGFFAFMEWPIKLKPLKIQRQTFRAKEKELTRDEYKRLLRAASSNRNKRLNLVLQTICSTGIRISELRYITLEAIRRGQTEISNKGKIRTVFLPGKLQTALLRYTKTHGVTEGSVFVTKRGNPLDRSNIWSEMKKLCEDADVNPDKVFPHNLRRLFARIFYGIDKDIMRLADILGHSDVNTTRIYLMESGETHRRRVERLGLVI